MLPRQERSCYCYLTYCYWAQELNSLPNLELCLELQNPRKHLLRGYPSTEEQSPPHDKPKATEQMQQQSCTDPYCDAAASSINFHLPVQPSLQGKGREQKCPEVLHGASSHQQPATAPPRRLERLRTQVTTLPSASWPCLSVTYSQGILEWTQDRRDVWQVPACIQVHFVSSHISSIRVSESLISVLGTSTVTCLSCSVGAGKAKVSGLPEQWIPQSCSTALKKHAFCFTILEMCCSCYFQRYC